MRLMQQDPGLGAGRAQACPLLSSLGSNFGSLPGGWAARAVGEWAQGLASPGSAL